MNPLTPSKIATILTVLIALTLVCFPLSPQARAVCQDACLTNDNTVQGDDALINLTTGSGNTAIGFEALRFNTTGGFNTANGVSALNRNTTGFYNTATGVAALLRNTTGSENTATGFQALFSNTIGESNTATGVDALLYNTTGSFNTASGMFALESNTTGGFNTANGVSALESNTTGESNTANGFAALFNNRTGKSNTATGYEALVFNREGFFNTATGVFALLNNTTGNNNTAIGHNALVSNTSGNGNIALGVSAGKNIDIGSNNIDIGNQGARAESDTIRIGTVGTQTKTFIAGISDAAIGGMEVRVNQNGRLGTVPSSKRFKELIKPMGSASEVLLALRPVTFRYKAEIDPEGAPQFGLVAEEVEKVNPDLVVRDKEGKPYTVRYDQVNAMLLNEFLKEHRKVEDQGAMIAKQQKQIEALTAGLQKVSAQLDASKPAPQVVNNP